MPGWLREKDGVESERVRAERGGHSRQRVQPGKGSWERTREGAKDGGCLEVKHLTVREPQGFGSEDALERVNVNLLSATGGSLASSNLAASIEQSDQLTPPFSPCPGTTLCEGFPFTGPELALVLPARFSPRKVPHSCSGSVVRLGGSCLPTPPWKGVLRAREGSGAGRFTQSEALRSFDRLKNKYSPTYCRFYGYLQPRHFVNPRTNISQRKSGSQFLINY